MSGPTRAAVDRIVADAGRVYIDWGFVERLLRRLRRLVRTRDAQEKAKLFLQLIKNRWMVDAQMRFFSELVAPYAEHGRETTTHLKIYGKEAGLLDERIGNDELGDLRGLVNDIVYSVNNNVLTLTDREKSDLRNADRDDYVGKAVFHH